MTDSWKRNKETKRDNSGDGVSRFFGLKRDHKIIMKKFALMIFVIGLVGLCSGISIGQTLFEIIEPLAKKGDAEAQYNLGLIYVNGQGVTQDYVQAHKWINITNENGHVNAKKFKERLEIRMTPKQIEEGKNLASDWLENHKDKSK